MSFLDLLKLALRNLREAKLRATLTTMGVIVGVAMIVTMISFGLGLQRNTIERFKQLDLFNEINVFGKTLSELAVAGPDANSGGQGDADRRRDSGNGPRGRADKPPEKILDDAALAEIAKIPGVSSVEPSILVQVYLRTNGRVRMQMVGGALVPNPATRFKEFAAGGMIADPEANDAVVDEDFVKAFGFADPNAAIGQTIDFLAPPDESGEDNQPNIMGMPIAPDPDAGDPDQLDGPKTPDPLVAKSFRIVGVLKTTDEQGQRKFRGLMPTAPVYIALPAIRSWRDEHRDDMGEIALELARQNGSLQDGQQAGYTSAVVRVEDPGALPGVRKKIGEMGFGSFSILDQLEQLRLIFLIINSVLGLLGGISLLVASFGIANTMIMSILERTREIGIMKAIGAEDREIKLIFFVEAAVIGFVGGCIGCLIALGIEVLANRLTYRFALKPQGASFVDFFAMPPYLWGSAIVFAVLIAVAAALYPAARAARIDPIKALRHD